MMIRALNARLARVLCGFVGAGGDAEEDSSGDEDCGDVEERLATLPLGGMKSILELSTEMHAAGYKYATLTDKTRLQGFKAPLIRDLKPRDALFFSKLEETLDDEFELDGHWAPRWYTWLQDNPLSDNYPIKNIMFAKFKEDEVIDLARDASVVVANCTELRRHLWYFDWSALCKAGFKGIKYDQEIGWYDRFIGWDVPTLAIWDATALYDVKLFMNAGTEYTYSATGQDVAV